MLALKFLKDLLNMAFIMFSKKASRDTQNNQILQVALRPHPKKTTGHKQLKLTAPLCLAKADKPLKFLIYTKVFQIFWVWQMNANSAMCSSRRFNAVLRDC